MARQFAWWTRTQTTTVWNEDSSHDLLDGSGLAVAGATIVRVIGTWAWQSLAGSGNYSPRAEIGVAVGNDLSGLDMFADDSRDYLYAAGVGVTPITAPEGDPIRTHWSQPECRFDVAGQRVLGSGESVWIAFAWANSDDDAIGVLYHCRTLVLLPDV